MDWRNYRNGYFLDGRWQIPGGMIFWRRWKGRCFWEKDGGDVF